MTVTLAALAAGVVWWLCCRDTSGNSGNRDTSDSIPECQ